MRSLHALVACCAWSSLSTAEQLHVEPRGDRYVLVDGPGHARGEHWFTSKVNPADGSVVASVVCTGMTFSVGCSFPAAAVVATSHNS